MKTLDKTRWKPWTKSDILQLKNMFSTGMLDYEIAKALNKSVEGVSAKRRGMGLSKRSYSLSPWSPEDDATLTQHVKQAVPFWKIATMMERTKRQIQYRSSQLGLSTLTGSKRIDKKKFVERHGNTPLTHMIVKRLHASKARARAKNLEFEITRDYLHQLYNRQEGKCYYSGLKMNTEIVNRSRNNNDPYSLSIERLDSTKGYVEGNIVLCCTIINMMKNGLSETEFINICKTIAHQHDGSSSTSHG